MGELRVPVDRELHTRTPARLESKKVFAKRRPTMTDPRRK